MQGFLTKLGYTGKGFCFAKENLPHLLMWERKMSPRAVRNEFWKKKKKREKKKRKKKKEKKKGIYIEKAGKHHKSKQYLQPGSSELSETRD